MKKQRRTYLLLGIVVIVWGIIGFKVVGVLSPEPKPIVVTKPIPKMQKPERKKDTFSLIANYQDPFLGVSPSLKKTVKRTIKKTPMVKKNIVYSGMVSQSGTSKALYFVSIDGKQHIISAKEEIDGVKLLRGNGEHIILKYNGIMETIALTE